MRNPRALSRFLGAPLLSAGVGLVIPLLLGAAALTTGFDFFTPPTLLVWPTMIIMVGLIGNQSHVTAVVYLAASALLNAAVYFFVATIVIRRRRRGSGGDHRE